MVASSTDLRNETFKCLLNLRYMIEDCVPKNKKGYGEFSRWHNETFSMLLTGESGEIFYGALYNAIRDSIRLYGREDRQDAYDAFLLELIFFNARYNYVGDEFMPTSLFAPHTTFPGITVPDVIREMPGKEKLEIGKTALDSIRALFSRLPPWARKILTVISEMLGIAKALTGG